LKKAANAIRGHLAKLGIVSAEGLLTA